MTKCYKNTRTKLSRKNAKLKQVQENIGKLEEKIESTEFKKETAIALVREIYTHVMVKRSLIIVLIF